MTFCIAIKVEEGLVGIADTRVTSGVECITAKKVTVFEHDRHSLFLMTSGLRSARDKALTYFGEVLEEQDQVFDKLYKAVTAFGAQVKRVRAEDKEALEEGGLNFNLFTLIGGQLENDLEHKLFLLYPQGNWVEVGRGTPYYTIGESSYGKSLLDRALTYQASMRTALKIGFLAFEATRRAATDVYYPIDIILYKNNSFKMVQHHYQREDLSEIGDWWQERIVQSIDELPSHWLDQALFGLDRPTSGGTE